MPIKPKDSKPQPVTVRTKWLPETIQFRDELKALSKQYKDLFDYDPDVEAADATHKRFKSDLKQMKQYIADRVGDTPPGTQSTFDNDTN